MSFRLFLRRSKLKRGKSILPKFLKLFQDETFYKALGNHLYIYVLNTVIVFAFALVLAILLTNSKMKGRNFYRVMVFFPSVIPAVIVNVLWMSVYNPSIGILNAVLGLFGIAGHNWLGDEALVRNSILFVMVWLSTGFYMVLFMAAIMNIPQDIYEAAKIDGCSVFRQTFAITIPLMWEQIRTALVFFIVTSCGVGFNVVYMLTKGGPNKASEILPTYMYLLSFGGQSKFGYAMAVATVIMVLTTALALLILRVTKRETYEM